MSDLVERLRGLLAKATPGPWEHMQGRGLVRAIRGDLAIPLLETREPYGDPNVPAETVRHAGEVLFRKNSDGAKISHALKREWSNAELTAAAVNALPGLLDTIEALTAERDRLREALEPFAKQATVDEILSGKVPNEFVRASPEKRLEMIGQRKRESVANILAARAALNGEPS